MPINVETPETKKVYSLYVNKQNYIIQDFTDYNFEIKVQCLYGYQQPNIKNKLLNNDSEILRYNDFYYLSFNRKALLKKGREIKTMWIEELQTALNKVENIVIK